MIRVRSIKGPEDSRTNVLQRKRRFSLFRDQWDTIETEDIPAHALISLGALGDMGGWVSRFTKYGTFDEKGDFTSLTQEGINLLNA